VNIDNSKNVTINKSDRSQKTWQHNPEHRRNVGYRDPGTAKRYGGQGGTAGAGRTSGDLARGYDRDGAGSRPGSGAQRPGGRPTQAIGRDGSMQRHIVRTMRCVSLSVALMALAPLHAIAAADITAPKTFASPAEAMRALVAALRKDDQPALIVILGPGSDDLVSSGDPVQDAGERTRVANAAMEHTRLETLASGGVT